MLYLADTVCALAALLQLAPSLPTAIALTYQHAPALAQPVHVQGLLSGKAEAVVTSPDEARQGTSVLLMRCTQSKASGNLLPALVAELCQPTGNGANASSSSMLHPVYTCEVFCVPVDLQFQRRECAADLMEGAKCTTKSMQGFTWTHSCWAPQCNVRIGSPSVCGELAQ